MRDARDVLERDPGGALGHEFRVAGRGRGIAEHHGPQPPQAHAEQMVRQQFRVHPGAGDAGLGEALGCLLHRGGQGLGRQRRTVLGRHLIPGRLVADGVQPRLFVHLDG